MYGHSVDNINKVSQAKMSPKQFVWHFGALWSPESHESNHRTKELQWLYKGLYRKNPICGLRGSAIVTLKLDL